MSTKKQRLKEEAIQSLRKLINPKEGITIVIKSVSRSGMMRKMKVYTRDLNYHLSLLVADALEWWYDNDSNAVKVGGCGMDMAFHLAYTLSHVLYTEEERKELTGNGGGTLEWKTI